MNTAEVSDALVFFGATGDLTSKRAFPALLAMVDDSTPRAHHWRCEREQGEEQDHE